jgi:NAD-dependent SIR2 family protein deacetylase
MARFHVRCSKCEARFVFKKRPEEYVRPPKCWSCGGRKYRIDKWMHKRDTHAMGCACMGYNWGGIMHRIGSLHCGYNTDGSMREIEYETLA